MIGAVETRAEAVTAMPADQRQGDCNAARGEQGNNFSAGGAGKFNFEIVSTLRDYQVVHGFAFFIDSSVRITDKVSESPMAG